MHINCLCGRSLTYFRVLKVCDVINCRYVAPYLLACTWGSHSGVSFPTCNVTQRHWVNGSRRFERLCRLCLREFPVHEVLFYMDLEVLQMRAVRSFETSRTVHPATHRRFFVYSRIFVPYSSSRVCSKFFLYCPINNVGSV